jgi:hypothetical protein
MGDELHIIQMFCTHNASLVRHSMLFLSHSEHSRCEKRREELKKVSSRKGCSSMLSSQLGDAAESFMNFTSRFEVLFDYEL